MQTMLQNLQQQNQQLQSQNQNIWDHPTRIEGQYQYKMLETQVAQVAGKKGSSSNDPYNVSSANASVGQPNGI